MEIVLLRKLFTGCCLHYQLPETLWNPRVHFLLPIWKLWAPGIQVCVEEDNMALKRSTHVFSPASVSIWYIKRTFSLHH